MINVDSNNNANDLENDAKLPEIITNNNNYKMVLREDEKVRGLTSEIDVQNPNSILLFGQKPSESISKVSDQLLRNMRNVKSEEIGEMLVNLTKIMDKFDVKEIENPNAAPNFLKKLLGKVQESLEKLFEKYDVMGKEVDAIYVLLKKYEADIHKSNSDLKKMLDSSIDFYQNLEKYIVAGEIALEEIDEYIIQFENETNMSENDKSLMLQKLNLAKEMLSQRVYDLQIAENVAMQTCPMINTMQMSNFNLMRKINSSFIITLPIFKQCLIQAITLKRQELQAKSIKQLDDKTNELLKRNAQMTASQSVNIAKMASGSSIQLETLQNTYETIRRGIEETKEIQAKSIAERNENSIKLENMKTDIKTNLLQ